MSIRTRLIAVFVAVFAMIGLTMPSAFAWGDKTKCPGTNDDPQWFHTNRWPGVFSGHHMDVFGAACYKLGSSTVPPHLVWVRKPKITFPSRLNPFALTEDVEVSTAPYVVATGKTGGYTTMVRYRYVVKQTAFKLPMPQYFPFTVTYTMYGSRICFVGGACDDWKPW